MPIKPSLFCYRNFGGVRFVPLQPRMVVEFERPLVAKLRKAGIKVRLLAHDMFVPEADITAAGDILALKV